MTDPGRITPSTSLNLTTKPIAGARPLSIASSCSSCFTRRLKRTPNQGRHHRVVPYTGPASPTLTLPIAQAHARTTACAPAASTVTFPTKSLRPQPPTLPRGPSRHRRMSRQTKSSDWSRRKRAHDGDDREGVPPGLLVFVRFQADTLPPIPSTPAIGHGCFARSTRQS